MHMDIKSKLRANHTELLEESIAMEFHFKFEKPDLTDIELSF